MRVLRTLHHQYCGIQYLLATGDRSRKYPSLVMWQSEDILTRQFHQVVRASTPFFTILTSTLLLGTRVSLIKMVALLPVVAGVGFA